VDEASYALYFKNPFLGGDRGEIMVAMGG